MDVSSPPQRAADAGLGDLRAQVAGLLPDLRGFARFLAGDRSAADDLVQDGVVRALASLEQFQPGTNLKAWLFTILRNAFYEGLRRRKREARLLPAGEEPSSAGPDAERRAEMRDLDGLIRALPPLQREALILVGAQEMTYEEAAVVCGVPVGTVKARVSRARAALSAALRQAEHDPTHPHGVGDT